MNGWKITAIIFIILFLLETSMIVWGMVINAKEVKLTNRCYYEVCRDYEQGYYANGLCTCYERDVLGQLKIAKYELMD